MARHHVGDGVPLSAAFDDSDGTAFDPPVVAVTIRDPDGGETTHEWPPDGAIVQVGTGRFSTTVTPDAPGRWRYWWSGSGDLPEVEPAAFDVWPLIIPGWRPTVDDVGAIIRARTKTAVSSSLQAGNEIGTFNDLTRPTGDQVERLIDESTDDVTNAVGTDICLPALETSARRVAALGTAMAVELSYFPEQIRADQSPYEALERRYKDRLKRLTEAVAENCRGGGGDSVSGSGQLATHTMPCGGDDLERF